ncbi:MAG: type IV toxin-antitoxin system AbiEi family antitoxin domain-containing protein [Allobranchiibius sp.]
MQQSTFPAGISSALIARAAAQGYAFTRSDAQELGCPDSQLRAWCRTGQLRTPGYGAYYLPPAINNDSSDSPTDISADLFSADREDAVRRIRSIVLTMNDSVVVTHESALLLHGLPVWSTRAVLDTHLSNGGIRTRTRRSGVRMHRSAPALQSMLIDNVWVASAAWAVAQTGCTLGLEAAVVAADAALHAGLTSVGRLGEACTELTGTRGSSALSALPRLVDGRSESPGESRLRLLVDGAGFDVTPQLVIRNEFGDFVARVDLALDGSPVIIEFDGMLKYRGAAARGALVAEKHRELSLNRLGYIVIRVTWEDLPHPERIVGWLRTAQARTGGRILW